MPSIAIVYATDTGNTRKVAKLLHRRLGSEAADLFNVGKIEPEVLVEYPLVLLGTPTLGDGELPESLEAFLNALEPPHLEKSRIALFGLGDQESYPEEFVDALGAVYDRLVALGGTVVGGGWPVDGYDYEASRAEREDGFVGLVLDQDNQADETEARLDHWLASLDLAVAS